MKDRLKLIETKSIIILQSSGILNKNRVNNALHIENIIKYIEENDGNAIVSSLNQEKTFDKVENNY